MGYKPVMNPTGILIGLLITIVLVLVYGALGFAFLSMAEWVFM